MTDGSTGEALYTSLRRCPDCGTPIARFARYCAEDRARRRALTFVSAARREAEPLGRRALQALHEAAIALYATGTEENRVDPDEDAQQ